jgi:acyl dehydratase
MNTAVKTTAITIDDLRARTGEELGMSAWREVSQADVDAFADVTGDHQWIHTDPQRAGASPFGGTIVHGYFTLALAPVLLDEVMPLHRFAFAVNYGLDRLRFPAPLPVGAQVRMRVRLDRVEEFEGGATLTLTLAFERSGGDRPVATAQVLYRVFDSAPGAS